MNNKRNRKEKPSSKREKAGFGVNICLFLNAGTTLFLLIEVTEIVLIFYFC